MCNIIENKSTRERERDIHKYMVIIYKEKRKYLLNSNKKNETC
jgi:uncharacterized protein YifE (UPF0438 family)